LSIPDIRKP